MSLKFSLRMAYIETTGIDPETSEPPVGKIKKLLEEMHKAKKHIKENKG